MPNFVFNILEIHAPNSKILDEVKSKIFSPITNDIQEGIFNPSFQEFDRSKISMDEVGYLNFEILKPTPVELLEVEHCDLDGENWWFWRLNNWGTHLNPCEQVISRWGDTSICLSYQTAWSFPETYFRHLAIDYPELEFKIKFCDIGGAFAGLAIAKDGRLNLQNFKGKTDEFYKFTNRYFWNFRDE